MSAPINQASELTRRALEAQHDWEVMFERLNQAERYPPADAPAAAPTPRRKTTRRDWRDFLGMLVILGLVAAGWWMFFEWQALGGPLH